MPPAKTKSKKSPYKTLLFSHLPNHCKESELRQMLKQFGPVKHVFLPRSKKTQHVRNYAFVIVPSSIAWIIANSLNNTLQFNKILQCKVIHNFDHKTLKRMPPPVSTRMRECLVQSDSQLEEISKKSTRKTVRRASKMKKRLQSIAEQSPNLKIDIKL
ncbi:MKI67 FHA domain-interacting nucleolar phosphoprotein [Cichlidogyrus casuarinus]|uniref:MKI67 FHA domain-interacting nucleolar phosphoprotein n=1 Tax=Cichlidogyrus casuarinus TaxID=1844966 RepID=A0ABD2PQY2_9PLAT